MEMNLEDTILTCIYSVLVGLFFSYLIMVIACAVLRIEVKFDDEPEDEDDELCDDEDCDDSTR